MSVASLEWGTGFRKRPIAWFLGGVVSLSFSSFRANRGDMYVPSLLRIIFIAQTVQHSRPLVDGMSNQDTDINTGIIRTWCEINVKMFDM